MRILPLNFLPFVHKFRPSEAGKQGANLLAWRWWHGLYGLLVVILFLYLRFPTSQFKAFCTDRVGQYFTGYDVSIESLRYRFPHTLVMDTLHLQAKPDAQVKTIDIPNLWIQPDFKMLGKGFFLSSTAYGGTHQSHLLVDQKQGVFTLSNMIINGLDLAQLPWLSADTGRAITGVFSAQGNFTGKTGGGIVQGSGEGIAQIQDGTFALHFPILSLTNLDLAKVDFLYKLENQKVILTKGKFNGKDLEGSFSGEINGLNGPFSAMPLALTGSLMPLPEFIKKHGPTQPLLLKFQQNHIKIPLRIDGTIGKPSFLLESRTNS